MIGTTRKLSQQEPCLLVEQHIFDEAGHSPTKPARRWKCMLSKQDARKSQTWIVDLDGIDDDELDLEDGVKSGITSLFVEGTKIVPSESKIIIPTNKRVVLEQDDGVASDRRSLSTLSPTVHSVLAIRVIANDGSTISSMQQIRFFLFYNGDNFRSQFNYCSYGHTRMEPFDGRTVTGYDIDRGVVEVTINENVSNGNSVLTIQNAVISQATELLGDLPSQFDKVMIILVRFVRSMNLYYCSFLVQTA